MAGGLAGAIAGLCGLLFAGALAIDGAAAAERGILGVSLVLLVLLVVRVMLVRMLVAERRDLGC